MKKAYVISIFCALPFLFMIGNALADETYGPGVFDDECATVLDPVNCCDRAADEATRVETARAILKVNARVVGGVPDVDHYHTVINYWAVNGSGEDGVGEDGAVYQETTLSNLGRQEMWDYLDLIFGWSSDMELLIFEEIWVTDPGADMDPETLEDNTMTYMLVNKWFGSTAGGYYEQPGISIVKFRPGEGCAAYQRDYFSEGDTWWGMDFSQASIRAKRDTVITQLGLTDKCVDDDGDGYTKYAAATGCPMGTIVDCDDYHFEINPAAEEIPGNGFDDDCDPSTSDILPWGTTASTINAKYKEHSDIANYLFLLCVPFGALLLLRRRRPGR